MRTPVPDFSADYSVPSEGGIGYRTWYERLVYPGKDEYVPMSLDSE